MSVLRAEHLFKNYDHRQVVNDVSLTLTNQEIVGILGPNGAGKTTSFYLMLGLVMTDKGHIYLDQTEITKYPIHRRARLGLGYLPQEPSIFEKMTVAENIMAILEFTSLNRQQRQLRLEELLNEFKISSLRHSLGITLSGGERRRVEIARALATSPKFILLDEPFAGVDPLSVADIKMMIRQLKQLSVGVLITDHNVRDTLEVCERVYIVHQGTVIASGSTQQILTNPVVQRTYLGNSFNLT